MAGAAALVISNIGMFFLSMETPLWTAAALNVIRNISIGSLMMPLLTWGTSNVHPTKMADASSLLTSLRTIAGSIGSAVFVGIMTMVAASSAETYGDNATMHGMNMSFFWMAVGAAVLLLIAVLLSGRKDKISLFTGCQVCYNGRANEGTVGCKRDLTAGNPRKTGYVKDF